MPLKRSEQKQHVLFVKKKIQVDHYANIALQNAFSLPSSCPLCPLMIAINLVWPHLGKTLQHFCRSIFQP